MSDFFTDDYVAELVQNIRRYGLENTVMERYYSKYPAIVSDTADPSEEGRVKVLVQILGYDEPLSLWAVPSSPYAGADRGMYFPPKKGDVVWVWFDHGDPTQPHYSGGWWLNPSRDTDEQNKPDSSYVPQEFKNGSANAPTTRGIKTEKGILLFEDDEGRDPRVELATISPNGVGAEAAKNHRLILSDKPGEEQVRVVSALGHLLLFDDQNELIRMATPNGQVILVDDANQTMVLSNNQSSIELSDQQNAMLLDTQGRFALTTLQDIVMTTQAKIDMIAEVASTFSFAGGLTIASSLVGILITGLTVTLASTTVAGGILLGAGAILRLVTETLIGIFNANALLFNTHEHTVTTVGVGNLGAPVASTGVAAPTATPMAVADLDSVTTNTVRAT